MGIELLNFSKKLILIYERITVIISDLSNSYIFFKFETVEYGFAYVKFTYLYVVVDEK